MCNNYRLLNQTEEYRRNQLREFGEYLIELSRDESKSIWYVNESTNACYCSKCGDYTGDITESITVSYERL